MGDGRGSDLHRLLRHLPSAKRPGCAGAFPPLAGHAPTILARPGGRDYLARLVLSGCKGPITVDGKPFNAAMPAWGEALNDEQLAGALDYVLHSWDNDKALPAGFQPFIPADIAAARSTKMTADRSLCPSLAKRLPAARHRQWPRHRTCLHPGTGGPWARRVSPRLPGLPRRQSEQRRVRRRAADRAVFRPALGQRQCCRPVRLHARQDAPDRPGKLNPQTYADLTAFLLGKNGYQPAQTNCRPTPRRRAHETSSGSGAMGDLTLQHVMLRIVRRC